MLEGHKQYILTFRQERMVRMLEGHKQYILTFRQERMVRMLEGHKQYILTFRQRHYETKVCARNVYNHETTTTKSDIILTLVISNSQYQCLSSGAVQILICSVEHPTGSLQIRPGKTNGEQSMEADIKQPKVHNKKLFKHYYRFITGPV